MILEQIPPLNATALQNGIENALAYPLASDLHVKIRASFFERIGRVRTPEDLGSAFIEFEGLEEIIEP